MSVKKKECTCHAHKLTPRSPEELKNLQQRLHRLEGQINGISKMLEEDRYCADILIQVSAAEKALKEIGYQILKTHLSTCVVDQIKADKPGIVDETMAVIKKLD